MEIINFEVFHIVGKCTCTLQGRARCREAFYTSTLFYISTCGYARGSTRVSTRGSTCSSARASTHVSARVSAHVSLRLLMRPLTRLMGAR